MLAAVQMLHSQSLVPRAETKYSQCMAQIQVQVPKLIFKKHSKPYSDLYSEF